MNKLSLRLKAVSDLIEEGSKVIDIGCDHGLLDIYLTKNKNCICLATDISSTCLKKAQDNIKKYNLDIETKVTNGLDGIFGTATQNAVISYQRSRGLTADGIVGCNTWRSLQEEVVGTGATGTTIN